MKLFDNTPLSRAFVLGLVVVPFAMTGSLRMREEQSSNQPPANPQVTTNESAATAPEMTAPPTTMPEATPPEATTPPSTTTAETTPTTPAGTDAATAPAVPPPAPTAGTS